MKRLRIGIIDMVGKGPTNTLWARIMHANLAAIMPTVVANWCEKQGHEVHLFCYTGSEEMSKALPWAPDVLFISAFTQAAQLAYATSNLFRQSGAITILGGPHARCYPQDSQKYFDYVLGFTNEKLIRDVLEECQVHRPLGKMMASQSQPQNLPGVKERWKFIEPTLKKAPFLKMVPMIGSMGCPYTCSFCIDSVVPYQPLDVDTIKEDLEFLLTKFKKPFIGWHDPNFGVRFDEFMEVMEEATVNGNFTFAAESSLSLLSEPHLKRLKSIGTVAILPGIESWYEMGNKSKTGKDQGLDKLNKISEHVNMILKYIPYIQTNFVMGLDCDEGPEPFELTKQFIDMSPGAFPGYSLLTAFGQAAPLNLEYQKEDRVLAFPFYFLNNHLAMNLKPKNYGWLEFYDHIIDVTKYSFSNRSIARRFLSSPHLTTKWMNVLRAISSEGYGRIRFFTEIRRRLEKDTSFRDFFEGETNEIPQFYIDIVRKTLGNMWDYLPEGALLHDPNAYLKAEKLNGSTAVVAESA